MYFVIQRTFGMEFGFSGTVNLDEMKQFREEALRLLAGRATGFGVLFDNRKLRPGSIDAEAQQLLVQTETDYLRAGMKRSCTLFQSAAVAMQLERTARQSGTFVCERFLNPVDLPDWHQKAMAWIERGVEPRA